ncbi:hypothetical protein PCE1_002298 [Barthelona sp. PCE]
MILDGLSETIKLDTPLVRVTRYQEHHNCHAPIVVKMEQLNPCHSNKDRSALFMIEKAMDEGKILPGITTVVEATAGCFGISLSSVCASKGIRLVLFMPDSVNIDHLTLLLSYGAIVKLSRGVLGMQGAQDALSEYMMNNKNCYHLDQFHNNSNSESFFATTATEIWRAVGEEQGMIDAIVVGSGTAGTASGIAAFFKRVDPNVDIIVVEPAESPVISGGCPGVHSIPGLGPSFFPPLLRVENIDEVFQVSTRQAILAARDFAMIEGIFPSASGGAVLHACSNIAKRPRAREGKLVVGILCADGERFLNTSLCSHSMHAAKELLAESLKQSHLD